MTTETAEFSLGPGVPVTFYRCKECHTIGTRKDNLIRHQQSSQACSKAGIQSMRTVMTDANVQQTRPACDVEFDSGVIPAGTPQEMDAMVRAIANNTAALRGLVGKDLSQDLHHLFPTLFTFTKGHEGPPELRNTRVQGGYVYEKQQHGETRTPIQRYVSQALVVNICTVLQRALCYTDEDFFFKPPDGMEDSMDALYDRVFEQRHQGARGRLYTLSQAAQLYAKGAKEFHASVPDCLKQAIMGGIREGVKMLKETLGA